MKSFAIACAGLACVMAPSVATAQTITFDAIGANQGDATWFGESYIENGIVFTSSGNDLVSWASGYGFNADSGGRTLFSNAWGSYLNFSAVNGGTFNLISLDIADGYNTPETGPVAYMYNIGGNNYYGTFTLDNLVGLQTFDLNLIGLTSFGVQQTSYTGNRNTYHGSQVDNVVLDIQSAVAEPSTWAMMLLGFGGIGYSMRRRRKYGAMCEPRKRQTRWI